MQQRDGRSNYQGTLVCRKVDFTLLVQHDQKFKDVTLHSRKGDVFRVDVSKFTLEQLRDFNGETCYVQYVDNGGIKMVCDIIKI